MKKRLLIVALIIIAIILIIFFTVKGCSKNKNNNNTSFMMYVEHFYNNDDSIYVIGKKDDNKIKVNDKVEIIGYGKKINTTVNQIIENDNTLTIRIDNVSINDIKRGMIVATPGKAVESKNLEIEVTLDKNTDEEIINGSTLVFDIGTENYAGIVKTNATIVRTQTAKIEVTLDDEAIVYVGSPVSVSTNGLIEFAKGKITKIIK